MKIAEPQLPRVLTLVWVAGLALVFAAAPFYYFNYFNWQNLWRDGELLLDWLIVMIPLFFIAVTVLKPKAGNGIFIGSWVFLGFASWDIVSHFPGSWVTGLFVLGLWAWAVVSSIYVNADVSKNMNGRTHR